jgi:hypothetical protein
MSTAERSSFLHPYLGLKASFRQGIGIKKAGLMSCSLLI